MVDKTVCAVRIETQLRTLDEVSGLTRARRKLASRAIELARRPRECEDCPRNRRLVLRDRVAGNTIASGLHFLTEVLAPQSCGFVTSMRTNLDSERPAMD